MSGNRASMLGRYWILTAGLLTGLVWTALASGQTPAEEKAAEMVLNSAKKGYNEKNYPFAIQRFREYLQKYGNFKQAPSARYGLALAMLELPQKDYPNIIKELQQLAGNKELPEHPYVLYFLGQSNRALGVHELAEAAAKPNEAVNRQAAAKRFFDEAGKYFTSATAAFTAKLPAKIDPKALPAELDWAARARCDLAEMQLRTEKPKDALATTAPFTSDAGLKESRYRKLGLYYHGFASYLLKDNQTAGRTLSQLAPFNDAIFGTHARYLLARVHHQLGERPEATHQYQSVLDDFGKQKAQAIELLKNRGQFRDNPEELARLDGLVKNAPPDHVGRAAFFLGVLRYEGGQFGQAQPLFADFAKNYPKSPLLAEAQLRDGFCLVRARQYPEALKILTPLVAKEPKLADQALFWIGKAQAGAADPANPQAYDQAIKTALNTLGQAAARAQQLAGADPTAKQRRGDILLEIGDTQQLIKQYKEAAGTYNQLLNEKLLPERDQEIAQRQISALHLAGDYNASDAACQNFFKAYPQSPLLAAVAFRHAENAFFRAEKAPKDPNQAKLFDEAIKRYEEVGAKYPEFELASLARYGLGLSHYHKGDIEKAQQALAAIPDAERNGTMAPASYLLADCIIRQAPENADDALSAGRLRNELEAAIKLLDAFLGNVPKGELTPDALIKLGFCQQRMASLFAEAKDRNETLTKARAAYERVMREFPKDELVPQAYFERAKCMAAAGDVNGAINELNRFNGNPFQQAPIAPMAVLRQASLMRSINRAQDAANLLDQCRKVHEGNLLKDPARAAWAPLLRYHHGLALQEAGKLPEARAVFASVVKDTPAVVEAAESAVRFAQCQREEGLQKMAAARKVFADGNAKQPQKDEARKLFEAGVKEVSESGQFLEGQIASLKQKQPTWPVRARMLYDAAWSYRTVAELEYEAARAKIQQGLVQKVEEEAKKNGAAPRMIVPPEVLPKQVPLQPSEQKVRALYLELLANFAELPLAVEARFELAELAADRREYEDAAKLLTEALEQEPRPDLVEKIRLRIGTCLVEKAVAADPGKAQEAYKSALDQFEIVAANEKSPNSAQAHYRAGECYLQLGDLPKAVNHLLIFRDKQPYQNVPGVSDRALLRLGHAYAQQKNWGESRRALETLIGRFGTSPWVDEARYSLGWALQHQNQFDQAVNYYTQVTAHTATENAAKAQLQIGLCRMAQRRFPEATTALLVVPFTYDYPELSATALFEAARALGEMKQPIQSRRLLQRLIRDYPDSAWAKLAREQLEKELKN